MNEHDIDAEQIENLSDNSIDATTRKKIEKEIKKSNEMAYSKKLIRDVRHLLWVVTVGGILLGFYVVYKGYAGSLPFISAMVGLPWSAHGVLCTAYISMSKSDHRGADGSGITYKIAEANNFYVEDSISSPPI